MHEFYEEKPSKANMKVNTKHWEYIHKCKMQKTKGQTNCVVTLELYRDDYILPYSEDELSYLPNKP